MNGIFIRFQWCYDPRYLFWICWWNKHTLLIICSVFSMAMKLFIWTRNFWCKLVTNFREIFIEFVRNIIWILGKFFNDHRWVGYSTFVAIYSNQGVQYVPSFFNVILVFRNFIGKIVVFAFSFHPVQIISIINKIDIGPDLISAYQKHIFYANYL